MLLVVTKQLKLRCHAILCLNINPMTNSIYCPISLEDISLKSCKKQLTKLKSQDPVVMHYLASPISAAVGYWTQGGEKK